MNFRFQNLLGAPYRGGNVVVSENTNLISPIGNRVSTTDLLNFQNLTLPFEASTNITHIAVSTDGNFLFVVDEKSHAYFINLRRHIVLHRITFNDRVTSLKFSPDGSLIAVGVGKLVQIWRSPGFRKIFLPFERVRTFTHCGGTVTSLEWSPDSDYLLVGSKDLTVRLFFLRAQSGVRNKPFLFAGHRDAIVGAFFCLEKKNHGICRIYTLSRDGAICTWCLNNTNDLSDTPSSPGTPDQEENNGQNVLPVMENGSRKRKNFITNENASDLPLHHGNWELLKKNLFLQAHGKLTACDYHRDLDMVVVGFSTGVFGLYQLPDFVCISQLSISREKITTALFNGTGNWLIFGCAKLGQLLVWEWRSDSYILKHQGHYYDVNCLAYSPDSQMLATGADDNKIKVWTVSSGSCFVTFSEHTNSITALHFVPSKHCLLSASLDGTVRAWDLFRYRNFKIFTSPASRQFVSLTSDQSGDMVCAGTLDSFEIFIWNMKNAHLLDILSGHEGPVHGLMFSPTNNLLASSSWDKTVRLWDLCGKGAVESFPHTHDVLTVAYRPDGKQLASSTLDGQIYFWDPLDGVLMYSIEGRRDITSGRLMTDRRSAANSTSGKCFTTLCYSADGSYILAGGSSKYICMYDVENQVLLRRFQITRNLAIDGVVDFLNSKNMTDAGPIDLIDDENSDIEDGIDKQTRERSGSDLPGAVLNRGRAIARTKCLRIAPTGRCWAAATTEGVLIYSIDESFVFDPTHLDMDVTPEAVEDALDTDQTQKALLISLRLNEDSLIKKCILTVKPFDVPIVASSIPPKYLQRLFESFADLLDSCPHLEFILQWSQEICKHHGSFIQQNSRSLIASLRSLQNAITVLHQDLSDVCSSNQYYLKYVCNEDEEKADQ
ncbi:Periodic tryptophan protein 2 [Zostera marina]|uniref:Periodic tryptophan protein 2 n=1 Tax=Zostera marina TaxID=29655 RepID=A0A0K9PUT6_ZOSMR|nr:Periodic tryptophan protein 2 [Zostera marina]